MWFMHLHPTRLHIASRCRQPHLLPGVPATSPPPPKPAVAMTTNGWSWSQDAVLGPHGAPLGPSMQWTCQQVCGGWLPWQHTSQAHMGDIAFLPDLPVSWELASDFTQVQFQTESWIKCFLPPLQLKAHPHSQLTFS